MKTAFLTLLVYFSILPTLSIFAGDSTITVNYPAPSGAYNKVVLQNLASAPDCTKNYTLNGTTVYSNAGVLYLDPTTQTLNMCTNDGTATPVPYPEACFNRFCSWQDSSPNAYTGDCAINNCPYGYSYGTSNGAIIKDKFNTYTWTNPSPPYHIIYYHTKAMICCSCSTPACTAPSTVTPQQ